MTTLEDEIKSFMEEVEVRDDDLKELSYSAYEEAMAFGLSPDTFLRYFKTIRDRCCQ